jgi:geranylgeranyl pyrophosphate synthase
MELEWNNNRRSIDMDFAIEIFKLKTAPAFEVSLVLGLLCAEADDKIAEPLKAYSEALGIAFQLKDDLEDFEGDEPLELRPSAIFAHICENCDEQMINDIIASDDVKTLLHSPTYEPYLKQATARVEQMVEVYRDKALEALEAITNIELKRLLYRILSKALK